jgi:GntR family transcriptional regulator
VENTGKPAFVQLQEALQGRISRRELQPGDQLPSATELMAEFGVSSTVVRSAINALKADGLVIGQQGRGVFVAESGNGRARPADDVSERLAAIESRLDLIYAEVLALRGRSAKGG